jgi:hypothetical protein
VVFRPSGSKQPCVGIASFVSKTSLVTDCDVVCPGGAVGYSCSPFASPRRSPSVLLMRCYKRPSLGKVKQHTRRVSHSVTGDDKVRGGSATLVVS